MQGYHKTGFLFYRPILPGGPPVHRNKTGKSRISKNWQYTKPMTKLNKRKSFKGFSG